MERQVLTYNCVKQQSWIKAKRSLSKGKKLGQIDTVEIAQDQLT